MFVRVESRRRAASESGVTSGNEHFAILHSPFAASHFLRCALLSVVGRVAMRSLSRFIIALTTPPHDDYSVPHASGKICYDADDMLGLGIFALPSRAHYRRNDKPAADLAS